MSLFDEKIFPAFCRTLKAKESHKIYLRSCTSAASYYGTDFLDIDNADSYAEHLLSKVTEGKLSLNYAYAEFSRARSVASFIEEHFADYGMTAYNNPFKDYAFPKKDTVLSGLYLPSVSELDKLLEASEDDDELYLAISLVLKLSLTVGECLSLKRDDFIINDDDVMLLRVESTDRHRYLKVPEDIRQLVSEYCSSHSCGPENYMFINRKGDRLQIRALQKRLDKACSSCDLHYNFNDIRNTGIAYMLKCGATEKEAAEFVGIAEKWIYRYSSATKHMHIAENDFTNIKIVKK